MRAEHFPRTARREPRRPARDGEGVQGLGACWPSEGLRLSLHVPWAPREGLRDTVCLDTRGSLAASLKGDQGVRSGQGLEMP